MKDITFITGNPAKAEFLAEYLKLPIKHQKLDLSEIQSLDLREIVEDKVKRAYEILKSPVLVEDASLELVGLKNLPGPLAKWFYETLGNEGLCRMLDSASTREAVTRCMFALYDGTTLEVFEGTMSGRIADSPRGESGFGFDPIFINDGFEETRGEMNKDDWAKTSMRTQALEELHKYITTNK